MRALNSDFKCRPFCNDLSAAPGVLVVVRDTRLRAQLMPPHACKHSAYTRHAGYKRSEKGGSGGIAREEKHGGALGASNPIWISTADRAAH